MSRFSFEKTIVARVAAMIANVLTTSAGQFTRKISAALVCLATVLRRGGCRRRSRTDSSRLRRGRKKSRHGMPDIVGQRLKKFEELHQRLWEKEDQGAK